MIEEIIKCNECGEEFTPGNRPDGLPNGIGIQMQDGRIYNICSECIIKLTPERIEEIKRKIK